MTRLNAYVLAADPTWLVSSVSRWYDLVDRLVVSYDVDGLGWSGSPIATQECLALLRELDHDKKIVELPGSYRALPGDLMSGDTGQRTAALAAAWDGADWVLQIDTDELLPEPTALLPFLDEAERRGLPAVEWPMRVLFRRTSSKWLEVVDGAGKARFEYPGPIAVRPGVRLVDGRRTDGPFLRPTVDGDSSSLQLLMEPGSGEQRLSGVRVEWAIVHNSWARAPRSVHRKVASWGHNAGMRSWVYYYGIWLPAPLTWRLLRNFHPLSRRLWPALAPLSHDLDSLLVAQDR